MRKPGMKSILIGLVLVQCLWIAQTFGNMMAMRSIVEDMATQSHGGVDIRDTAVSVAFLNAWAVLPWLVTTGLVINGLVRLCGAEEHASGRTHRDPQPGIT